MTIRVVEPTGRPVKASTEVSGRGKRPAGLEASLRVSLLDNLKPAARPLLMAFRESFETRFGEKVGYWEKKGPLGSAGAMEFAESLADSSGAVLNAVGD